MQTLFLDVDRAIFAPQRKEGDASKPLSLSVSCPFLHLVCLLANLITPPRMDMSGVIPVVGLLRRSLLAAFPIYQKSKNLSNLCYYN